MDLIPLDILQYKICPYLSLKTSLEFSYFYYLYTKIILKLNYNAIINNCLLREEIISDDFIDFCIKSKLDLNRLILGYYKKPLPFCNISVTQLKKCLDNGLNPHIRDSGNNTLLHSKQNRDIIKLLISYKSDVNAYNIYKNTPINTCNNCEKTRILINSKADINIPYKSPLFSIRCRGQTKLLLESKADVNSVISGNMSPLHSKFYTEDGELLMLSGLNPNVRDRSYYTPLHLSCQTTSNVQLLIDFKADVNALNDDNQTPLHLAKNIDNVLKLILNKADLSITCDRGKHALHHAKTPEIARIMLQVNRSIVNYRDDNGKTALHYANNAEHAKVLLEFNADPNIKDYDYRTPLWDHTDINHLKCLLDAKANVNTRDRYKKNMLTYPGLTVDKVKLLLESDIKVNVRDIKKRTPLYYYVDPNLWYSRDMYHIYPKFNLTQCDQIEIVKILIQHKAQIYTRDINHFTPINYSKVDAITKLLSHC